MSGFIGNATGPTRFDDSYVAAQIAALMRNAMQGRLTLTSATPVTTSDVTAATAVYYTPYIGDLVAICNGTTFSGTTFTELTLNLASNSGYTNYHQSGKGFDVFVYSDAGTLRLGTGPAWSSDTARGTGAGTTEIERYKGMWVNKNTIALRWGSNSSDTTSSVGIRQATYVGSIYCTANGQTEDSMAKRNVWNCYNRAERQLKVVDTTDSWSYTLAAFRQVRAQTSNQVDVLRGLDEDLVDLKAYLTAVNNNASVNIITAIGLDSTTAKAADCLVGYQYIHVANYYVALHAKYDGLPGLGKHSLTWLEYSAATGTTTFIGDGGTTIMQSGLIGKTKA